MEDTEAIVKRMGNAYDEYYSLYKQWLELNKDTIDGFKYHGSGVHKLEYQNAAQCMPDTGHVDHFHGPFPLPLCISRELTLCVAV